MVMRRTNRLVLQLLIVTLIVWWWLAAGPCTVLVPSAPGGPAQRVGVHGRVDGRGDQTANLVAGRLDVPVGGCRVLGGGGDGAEGGRRDRLSTPVI